MAFNERIFEREEVKTANPHPIATGISIFTILMGIIGFAYLLVNAGCNSPPDDNCAEVDKCDNGDVDGSVPDQPDGGANCAVSGTCPDAASNTDAAPSTDAPSTATCAANAWMENPEMFDCDFFDDDGTIIPAHSCDPELLIGSSGCEVKCGPFWATPNQLNLDPPNHMFDYRDIPGSTYPRYRCFQRQ